MCPSTSAYTQFWMGAWYDAMAASKFAPVLRQVDAPEGGKGRVAVIERRPAQCQRLGCPLHDVGDDRAVTGAPDGDDDVGGPLDLDRLVGDRHRFQRAVVLGGAVGVEPLDVEILHVGHEVRDAPGNALVVANARHRARPAASRRSR